jgi:preprotein translocase subunit SecF
VIAILLSSVYIFYFYNQNGDFFKQDVSLTGGTSITLETSVSYLEVEKILAEEFSDFDIRSIADNSGKQTHLIIMVPDSKDKIAKDKIISVLEKGLDIEISEDNSSIEFTGGSLGSEFYKQLLSAMFFAFLLMALVVFLTFGESKIIKVYTSLLTMAALKLTFPMISQISFIVIFFSLCVFFYGLYLSKSGKERIILIGLLIVNFLTFFLQYYFLVFVIGVICLIFYIRYSAPSVAVLIAAFSGIFFTIVTINLVGIKISSGGIIALLMLIGYSVGTDILLTSRVLKRENESVNSACFGAFKTGFPMTLTAVASIAIGLWFVYPYGTILNQIFFIMLIGLLYDLPNTWITNVLIIKWYAESRDKIRSRK